MCKNFMSEAQDLSFPTASWPHDIPSLPLKEAIRKAGEEREDLN